MSLRHDGENKEFVCIREDNCGCDGWRQREQFTGRRGSHCLMLAWVFPRNVSNPTQTWTRVCRRYECANESASFPSNFTASGQIRGTYTSLPTASTLKQPLESTRKPNIARGQRSTSASCHPHHLRPHLTLFGRR